MDLQQGNSLGITYFSLNDVRKIKFKYINNDQLNPKTIITTLYRNIFNSYTSFEKFINIIINNNPKNNNQKNTSINIRYPVVFLKQWNAFLYAINNGVCERIIICENIIHGQNNDIKHEFKLEKQSHIFDDHPPVGMPAIS